MRYLSLIAAFVLALAASRGQCDSVFGGGGGPAGSFNSPNFTGSPTFYTDRCTISDGGDRLNLDAEIFQFKTGGNTRLYVTGKTGAYPQLTTLNADIWLEPGDGGATQGSIAAYNSNVSDLGYSTFQQADLAGARPFRNLWLSDSIRWVTSTDRAVATTASTTTPKLSFGGTIAGGDFNFNWSNVKALVIKNGAGSGRYLEIHLGLSSIYKIQTDVDAWINDAKFVSYSSSAAKARVGDATLSSGTVTVTNTNNDANDRIFVQLKTPGGTLCAGVKYSINAGSNFTLTSVQADGTTCTTDTSTYSWWIINKQS